jgi:isopentenyl phosphate kinase
MAWDIYRNHITGHLASEPMSDSKFDVTGGINLKLNTAKNIVIDSNGRILVYICNVTSKPADVLQEDSTFKGTVVQLKQQT